MRFPLCPPPGQRRLEAKDKRLMPLECLPTYTFPTHQTPSPRAMRG